VRMHEVLRKLPQSKYLYDAYPVHCGIGQGDVS